MRPPQNAGENGGVPHGDVAGAVIFNEAPAKRGGKPLMRQAGWSGRIVSSMRPPQNAGENVGEQARITDPYSFLQ